MFGLVKKVGVVILGSLMEGGEVNSDGGDGSLIVFYQYGNFVPSINFSGMDHGRIYKDGLMKTGIFWDEENDHSSLL